MSQLENWKGWPGVRPALDLFSERRSGDDLGEPFARVKKTRSRQTSEQQQEGRWLGSHDCRSNRVHAVRKGHTVLELSGGGARKRGTLCKAIRGKIVFFCKHVAGGIVKGRDGEIHYKVADRRVALNRDRTRQCSSRRPHQTSLGVVQR